MKYLQPLILTPGYFEPIEAEINRIFFEMIYAPLLKVLKESGIYIHNAADAVADAIREGRVYYEDGVFKGSFNSSISKRFKQAGAKYLLFKKAWAIEPIPGEWQAAMADYQSRANATVQQFVHTLDSLQVEKYVQAQKLAAQYDTALGKMEATFRDTVKHITIPPQFAPGAKELIAREWAQNLSLYIIDWSNENILKLRTEVMQHAFKGGRAESIKKLIQKNYDVSLDKARFLARQETSLLMSKFRESRYKDIGSNQYKWNGANDERERPDHKLLNGTIHSWNDPPVTNRQTGARNHPGEDFGCRCTAIPIVKGFNDAG